MLAAFDLPTGALCASYVSLPQATYATESLTQPALLAISQPEPALMLPMLGLLGPHDAPRCLVAGSPQHRQEDAGAHPLHAEECSTYVKAATLADS